MPGNKVTVEVRLRVTPSDGSVSTSGRKIFRVAVDYDATLEQMIAAGQYDSDYFEGKYKVGLLWPQKGQATVAIELFEMDGSYHDLILVSLEDEGYRPANLPELLALGAQFPVEQRRNRIVGLGTIWRNSIGLLTAEIGSSDYAGRYVQFLEINHGHLKSVNFFAAIRK